MKILILTTIYKDIDDPKDAATTPVVQNFAKEWVKAGNEVLLIHNFNVFAKAFYFVPQAVWDKLSSKKGFRTVLSIKQTKDISYERDGVKVYRSTIKKLIPLGAYTESELCRSVGKIERILDDNAFVPDVIVCHMENPQIYQAAKLKEMFPKTITSLVFHEVDYLQQEKYKRWKEVYLPTFDKIGFRSLEAYREACDRIGFNRDEYFLCPSGISNEFVETIPNFEKKFSNEKVRILYVGQFIPRKHVDTIIFAVNKVRQISQYDLSIDLVGGGVEEGNLRKLVKELNMEDCILFSGRLPHEAVLKKMQQSDIFVMVSSREVFGLVYTEAMSQGCIVVASTQGGMEGIIQDGINGYMSPAGDSDELAKKLLYIIQSTREENIMIAKASYATAQRYTERAVAEQYLNNILQE